MSYLCLKRDIPEGGYKVFDQFGESYIAKKQNDKIVVAKNSCSHRGMKVALCDSKGTIRCPYHGKRFEFEKRVVHHEFGEFIFAHTHLGVSDPLRQISPLIGEEFGSHDMFVRAPFHLWMQNTADPNHLSHAHKESFAKLFDGNRPENNYVSEFESSYTMRIKDEVVEKYGRVFGADRVGVDFYHYLGFPNLSVTGFLGVFYSVETAIPCADGSRVYTRFFMRRDLKARGFLLTQALAANKTILEEDRALVERWALNYKYEPNDIKWLPGEDRIKRYADEIKARGLE